MRIVGFVPSKLNSERVPRKNVRMLGNVPLVNYALRALNQVKQLDDIVIFASEDSIVNYLEDGLRYTFMKRPAYLDTNDAKVQDFLWEFIKREKAEIIVLLHITSPFIRSETISECIDSVKSDKYDSAFAALKEYSFAWFKGKPLNYSLKQPTPRTQDIEPVVFEQSGLYVFGRELFKATRRRIGQKPYIKFVDRFQGHDIDTLEDLDLANLMLAQKVFA